MWIVLWSHDLSGSIGDNRLSGSMSTKAQKEALEGILGLSNKLLYDIWRFCKDSSLFNKFHPILASVHTRYYFRKTFEEVMLQIRNFIVRPHYFRTSLNQIRNSYRFRIDPIKTVFSESIYPYNSTSKGPSNQTPKIRSVASEAITLCQ